MLTLRLGTTELFAPPSALSSFTCVNHLRPESTQNRDDAESFASHLI